jgi:hypothetical protein
MSCEDCKVIGRVELAKSIIPRRLRVLLWIDRHLHTNFVSWLSWWRK